MPWIAKDEWSFVALALDPDQAVLYLGNEGALQSATNYESHVIQNFDVPSRIGNDAYSAIDRTFDGMIDEMAVFDRTLSLEAVSPCVIHPDAAKKFYRVVVQ